MSTQSKFLKPLSIAIGATFALSMAASNIASATPAGDNPFAMSELQSGYMQVAGKDGKCGEGKCGDNKKDMKSKNDGKCGGNKKDMKGKKDGKCGGDKKDKKGKKDGKCGEGKCGDKT